MPAINESRRRLESTKNGYRALLALDHFLDAVPAGFQSDIEIEYEDLIYDAFEPMRDALPLRVRLFRGQPVRPPALTRRFLSWTPSLRMAADFATDRAEEGAGHIIEAEVARRDIVAGLDGGGSKYDTYFEFLVCNRKKYQKKSSFQVPDIHTLALNVLDNYWEQDGYEAANQRWMAQSWDRKNEPTEDDRRYLRFLYPDWKKLISAAKVAVERAGGIVVGTRPPDPVEGENGPPRISFVMRAGKQIPSFFKLGAYSSRSRPTWMEYTEDNVCPDYVGRV